MSDTDELPARSSFFLKIFLGTSVLAVAIGLSQAVALRFVNDDAFISFRYAKNLVNGLGLVYNAGERVEGFTNFLWTLLIALGMTFHLDPVPFSMNLGIIFFCCTLILCCFLTWQFSSGKGDRWFLIPVAALGLAFHRDFCAYATSGLETAMFTFLILLGFVILLFAHSRWRLILAGLVLVLAMMTRPDGIVFVIASLAYIFLTNRQRWKSMIYFLIPSLVLFLPYWLWRYSYYGYFFPNAFYAKSIGLPYYTQGLEYARLYFITYYGFSLTLILIFAVLWKYLQRTKPLPAAEKIRQMLQVDPAIPHPILLGLLFILLQTLFIIRIGGDFMFARFFIPITPMLVIVTENAIQQLSSKKIALIAGMLFLATILFRYDQFASNNINGYVADEPRYYSWEHLWQSREHGKQLNKYFRNKPVRVAFWGGQDKLVYYADPAYAVETNTGLTDATIAHQEISKRGRPGHEKVAPTDYLEKHNVHFYIGPVTPPKPGEFVLNMIVFDSLLARIITYDNGVMEDYSREPGIHFVRMPQFLDSYLAKIDTLPIERAWADFTYFKTYYFDHNKDEEREGAFLRYFTERTSNELH